MALSPGSKLYSIVYSKCPRCNVGDLYVDNRPYVLKNLSKMKKQCDCCGQKYEPETGFYYGAMYVSYGLTVGLVLPLAALLYWGLHVNPIITFALVAGLIVLLYPLIFRWSRNIWLNMFVKFDPEQREEALANCGEGHLRKTA